MKAAVPSLPVRILKRADVDAGLARQAENDGAVPAPAPAGPGAPLAKEARLVQSAPGGSLLELRCSCGEWTRLQLNTGERGLAGEQR